MGIPIFPFLILGYDVPKGICSESTRPQDYKKTTKFVTCFLTDHSVFLYVIYFARLSVNAGSHDLAARGPDARLNLK